MGDSDLPGEFDVVVLGTGLVESIVSAASARNGHSVLHLDPREYYGANWATLSFDQWTDGKLSKEFQAFDEKIRVENDVKDFEQIWYFEDENVRKLIDDTKRRFNIDIFPKAIEAREELIQLLIDSNVSRYLEFKCVTRLLTNLEGIGRTTIEEIPLSKSDIFTSKSISLLDKRTLMKFIENITKGDDQKMSFEEIAKSAKISPKVTHLIKAAIGDGIYEENFVPVCQRFLGSIGRYGNSTPFLWTLYGISEVCQAFCRLSAIYGGIFILNRPIESLNITPDQIELRIKEKEFKTKFLVLGPEFTMKESKLKKSHSYIRALLITTGLIKKSEKDVGVISKYKIDHFDVIELDHSSLAVSKDFKLIHITCKEGDKVNSIKTYIEEEFSPFLNFSPKEENDGEETDKADVLYASYFRIHSNEFEDFENDSIFYSSPFSSNIDESIAKAKKIFEKIYPEEEFLPPAPSPDEQIEENEIPMPPEPESDICEKITEDES